MPQLSDPRELFVHELKDVLYAETLLVKALPAMAKEATDDELRESLNDHLDETRQQIENLKEVFAAIGERAKGEQCPGMDGIKREHDVFMEEEDPSAEVRDLFLTGAGARVEHYEIAAYSGLVAGARSLGERECVRLLQENLKQERAALRKLETISRRLHNGAKQLARA